ncbi:MAG: GntR family transcriptional regulator [Lacipirellulaceae bacterium]
MSNKPLARTLREQIADRIRSDVLSGRLEKGSNLREQSLAKQYGVSRAPIRDALLQLTQEGLLEAKPNCGVRVGSAAAEELQPLIVGLRRETEIFALELVFDRLTDEDCDKLDATVEGLRKACETQDLSQVVHYDMALHRYILETAGSSDLIAIWLPIVSRMMLHYSRHVDMMESYREHEEIVKAIRAKDREAAIAALTANIQ